MCTALVLMISIKSCLMSGTFIQWPLSVHLKMSLCTPVSTILRSLKENKTILFLQEQAKKRKDMFRAGNSCLTSQWKFMVQSKAHQSSNLGIRAVLWQFWFWRCSTSRSLKSKWENHACQEYYKEALDISGILHLVSKNEIYSKWSTSGSS